MVLGVSGSWRHITPGKESLGLGSRRIVPGAARVARRTSGEKLGWKRAFYSLRGTPRRDVDLSARSLPFASIVCWLLEPEVGVALGRTGLLRRAAARFPPAGLQHSGALLREQMVAQALRGTGF